MVRKVHLARLGREGVEEGLLQHLHHVQGIVLGWCVIIEMADARGFGLGGLV